MCEGREKSSVLNMNLYVFEVFVVSRHQSSAPALQLFIRCECSEMKVDRESSLLELGSESSD